MRYVEIRDLLDGAMVPQGRVWEDGRFQGQPGLISSLGESCLLDPETGRRATHGDALLNAVERSFNTGYTTTRRGEDDSGLGQQRGNYPRDRLM